MRNGSALDDSHRAQAPPRTQAPPRGVRAPGAAVTQRGRAREAARLPGSSGALGEPRPPCRCHLAGVAIMCSAGGSPLLGAVAAASGAAEQVSRLSRSGRGGERAAGAASRWETVGAWGPAGRRGPRTSPLPASLPAPARGLPRVRAAPSVGPRGHIRAPRLSVPVTLGGRCSPPAPGSRSPAVVLSRRLR